MYANRIPFTRDGHKGPVASKTATKKATKPAVVESVVEEPAKIELEPIDLIIEAEAPEVSEETNGND
jgi:hypothetical protein